MPDAVSSTETQTPSPVVVSSALSWSVHEFEHKDRHPDWMWYVGLIFGIAAVLSFFYGNIFFGIFLCIAGTVIIIYAKKKPKLLTISIDKEKININNEPIPHDKITQFWLDETDKADKLLLQVTGSFVPVIALPLEGVTADRVRAALKPYVKEEFLRESRSIKIFDRIGF